MQEPQPLHPARAQAGVAVLWVLMTIALLSMILLAYSRMTLTQIRLSSSDVNQTRGYHAAEGGINLRADSIRAKFIGSQRPSGSGPSTTSPCTSGNMGSGDMTCQPLTIGERTVMTYVQDITNPSSGEVGTVSVGEPNEGLTYLQYSYRIRSESRSPRTGNPEARLEVLMQSRLIPLFQFAAFYNRDLELHPGPAMTLNGRVHTNANLYLNANNSLSITGTVTAAGDAYHKGKDGRGCQGAVKINNTSVGCNVDPLTKELAQPFNGRFSSRASTLNVPGADYSLLPKTGAKLWDRADVRIVAVQTSAPVSYTASATFSAWSIPTGVTCESTTSTSPNWHATCYKPGAYIYEVRNADGSVNNAATSALQAGNIMSLSRWWDGRERRYYDLINVDQAKLFEIINTSAKFRNPDGGVLRADDATDNGMAWHLSVDDKAIAGNDQTNNGSKVVRNYAFRIGKASGDAASLGPTSGTRPKGLTITSNQPVYTWGNYNTTNKIPASIISDAMNILSGNAPANMNQTGVPGSGPAASATSVNAAFISGIDDTIPGSGPGYNGGLQNYPRFHENWSNITFTYRGSFVSMNNSMHTSGGQNQTRYSAPNRDWNFDTDFLDAAKLPPLTPHFIYLRQLNFAREY